MNVAGNVMVLVVQSVSGRQTREIADDISDLVSLVGNTPLLEIKLLYRNERRTIFAKYEALNFTGSIKDRMVLSVIRQAHGDGSLKPGDTIVETTSGNTGISCAAIGRALGYPVKIFMPDWMSRERMLLIESLGAQVVLISKEEGGFIAGIDRCEHLAATRNDVFLPRQFSNPANIGAHLRGTGPEIHRQLQSLGRKVDAFVAGVGTGGTVMGVGQYLKAQDPGTRIYPVEPLESPTLSTGRKVGRHRIQGISDDFIPDLLELGTLDEVLSVSDGDSILMAQKLAGQLGLGVGISSGCNLLAALQAQDRLGESSTVATVFCDDNKKYLSTALCDVERIRPGYMSPHVQLLSFRSHECPPQLLN